jgi:hypothetical protein
VAHSKGEGNNVPWHEANSKNTKKYIESSEKRFYVDKRGNFLALAFLALAFFGL